MAPNMAMWDVFCLATKHRTCKANSSCCLLRPRTAPFPEEKSILGVIHGVLLWDDIHTVTPQGAWGRYVMSLDINAATTGGVGPLCNVPSKVSIAPVSSRNLISLNNIPNSIRHFYEKRSHNNRKCGRAL